MLKQDVYERITNQIIAAIEAGAGKWQMPWSHDGQADITFPVNVITKKAYRGINVVAFWAAAEDRGFKSGVWGTYNQWQEVGAQVRKGERGTTGVVWKIIADEEGEPVEDESGRKKMFARAFTVFNADQVDGYQAPVIAPRPEAERIQTAESFIQATGAQIRHGGNRAYYSPGHDFVQMPEFRAFNQPKHYYATLAHELTHWTSAEKRCNRQLGKRFGDDAYAAEELIAELGAAFLCAALGIPTQPREDHAAYIASWLKVLKNDKRAIFTAAGQAQRAADWLLACQAADEAAA